MGSPQEVGGDFHCDDNKIVSLEGVPCVLKGNLFADGNLVSESTLRKILNFMKEYGDYGVALALIQSEKIRMLDNNALLTAYPIDSDPSLLKKMGHVISESPDSMRILSVMKQRNPIIWKKLITQMESPEAGEESTILGDYGF